ncbi:hypothetical protein RP20_CCG010226 [Aedes albopictus]|nr:hypothetical protein RP20_CCG010226 [Aedes albopictus]
MLALFDVKVVKTPEILVNFKNLYVDKVQCPLALTPCTDDDVVPEPDTRRIWQTRSTSLGVPGRGARGGSVDRGRGRGRGLYLGYQRSTSFYDDESRSVGRGERPWLERNGTGGPLGAGSGGAGGGGSEVDWNSSSTSPRKEFGGGLRARTANMESWRRSTRPDDEPSATDWRSGGLNTSGGSSGGGLSGSSGLREKWSRSTSWRDEDGGTGDGLGRSGLGGLHPSVSSERIIPGSGAYKPRLSALSGGTGDLNTSGGGTGPMSALRRNWDTEDQLPEWATENPSDYGGSFDASGAFHDSDNDVDGRLDGDDGGKENHVNRKEGSSGSSRRSGASSKEGSASKELTPNHMVEKADLVEDPKKGGQREERKEEVESSKPKEDSVGGKDKESKESSSPHPSLVETLKTMHDMAAEIDIHLTAASSNNSSSTGEVSSKAEESPNRNRDVPKKSASSSSVDRMQEVADDMVAQLIMDDEYTGAGDPDPTPVSRSLDKSPVLGAQIPINLLLSKEPVAMQQLFASGNSGSGNRGMLLSDVNRSMLHGVGPQMAPQMHHNGTDIWYYRDPQGKVQGPFPASEMTEWYRAGYFDDSLSVRRACDEIYTTLGQLVALCGGAIPFLNSMSIPPIKSSSKQQPQSQPQQAPQAPTSSFQQQKPASTLQHHLQQQAPPTPLDTDLTAHVQFTKKLHLIRQQGIILQKLSSTEGWSLLSQEQQNAIMAQHMAQLQLNDSLLMSPSPLAPSVPASATSSSSNPPNPASNLNVDPTAGHDHLGQLIHNINFNHQPPVQNLPLGSNMLLKHNLIGNLTPQQQQQQQSQPSQQPQAPKPNLESDPIQSLLMQLSMHKQQQQQPPPPQPSKTPAELMTPWLQTQSMSQQQPQQAALRTLGSGWGDLPPTSASFGSLLQQPPSQQPQHLAGHPLVNASSANEPQAPSVVSLFKHHQQSEKQNQEKLVSESHQQQQQQQQHLQQQQLQHQLQQQQQQQQQQTQHHNHQQQQQQQQQQQLQQQQQQSTNHQQHFERTHQKQQLQVENIVTQQQQQVQQQQQPQQQQQQPQYIQKPQKEDRKEQEHLAQQQLQQQQQQQQAQQQLQQRHFQQPAKQEKQQSKPNQQKAVNNIDVEEQQVNQQLQQQQQQQPQQQQVGKFPQQKGNKKQQQSKQQQQQHAADDDQGDFINVKKEMEEKKRQKELKRQQQEELKRKQAEEKKKQEEQEAQKKAKLLETQRREAIKIQEQQQPRPATKVAPWSSSVGETVSSGPRLDENQKAERERRPAVARQEQSLREQQQQQEILELQTHLDSKLKWNAQNLIPQNVKSLAEIQAEEAAAADRAREKNAAALTAASIAASAAKAAKKEEILGTAVWQSQGSVLTWNTAKLWSNEEQNNLSSGGFWEEPNPSNKNGRQKQNHQQAAAQHHQQQQHAQNQKQLLSKSKTMGSISTASSSNAVAAAKQQQQKNQMQQHQQHQQQQHQKNASKGASAGAGKHSGGASGAGGERKERNQGGGGDHTNEFTGWCTRALTSLNSNVDIPTFVGFLQDIESPFEVKDYIRLYLGETKECAEFAKQFLERRSKYKNQMRQKNAHIDDMCKPAPAINPSSNDFQEIKGKNKKVKKNKMTKLDNRCLGFSVTAAPDRLNVGDRDYGDNA